MQEICQDLIVSAVDDSTFLSEIVACDEAWCFLCDSQTKCEPNDLPVSPQKTSCYQVCSKEKLILDVFFNTCLIPKEFIPKGPTVNKELYTSFEVFTVV